MFKKLYKTIKDFFVPLGTTSHTPDLDFDYDSNSALSGLLGSTRSLLRDFRPSITVTEEQHRRNLEKIEVAKLEQERDAIDKNLLAQHRLMIVTITATFIALFSSISAIIIAINQKPPIGPTVNVAPSQPDVNIYIPESTVKEDDPQ